MLPAIPAQLPKTQPDWTQFVNIMQAWQQALNAAAAGGPNAFSATCPDISGTPKVSISYSQCGNLVTLRGNYNTITGTSTGILLRLTGFPSALIPATKTGYSPPFPYAVDGGASCQANMQIDVDGTIYFLKWASSGSLTDWSASGTKTAPSFEFTYGLE